MSRDRKHPLVGLTIVGVRLLGDEEAKEVFGWDEDSKDKRARVQLELSNGSFLTPCADLALSGFGVLLYTDESGDGHVFETRIV